MQHKNKLLLTFLVLFLGTLYADAQMYRRPGVRGRIIMRNRTTNQRNKNTKQPAYEPSVHLKIGYGFQNLDKNILPTFYGATMGNVQQNGPFMGSIDYQFSQSMSVGVLITHGTVSASYYDFSNLITPAFNGKLDNWSYMLNLMHYMKGSKSVTPFVRTAIGINSWQQTYTDMNGNKAPVQEAILPDFAYQVGIGTKIKISTNAGFSLEAGYGKYIVQAGLNFKF